MRPSIIKPLALWLSLCMPWAASSRAQAPALVIGAPETVMTGASSAWVLLDTSVPAIVTLDYHPSGGIGRSVSETEPALHHAIPLTGLVLGITYEGTIAATAPEGTATLPLPAFVATAADQDARFVIAPQAYVIAPDEALIAFTTTVPARSSVSYGIGGALDQWAQEDDFTTTHALFLPGIQPGAAYSYLVSSVGMDGGVVSTAPGTFLAAPLERDFQPGDVDGDDRLTFTDALLALRYALGLQPLSPMQFQAADINGDGAVNVKDAVLILKKAMGL